MTQTAIPYLLMRGGTSRGPYFRRSDVPEDLDQLAETLIAVVGSGHPLNIDGVGGGAAVTTKVAMLSAVADDGADIDYFFAQVSVEDRLVDYKPTCGNMLVGVGPAAIELGLFEPQGDVSKIRIRCVNTGALVDAEVQTPGGRVAYAGATAIDGVPGTASPIGLQFREVVGSATGALLPTGNTRDTIQGIEVTCMDVAMPMVIAQAEAFGLTGAESVEALDNDSAFLARMEAVRIEAGARMGLGDVTKSVTPKFGLIAAPQAGGTMATRYFMPWHTHPTLAVTGSQCLASCVLVPGTVADGLAERPAGSPATIVLEHPSGSLEVVVDYGVDRDEFTVRSAGVVRTARKLADGHVYVPATVWAGK